MSTAEQKPILCLTQDTVAFKATEPTIKHMVQTDMNIKDSIALIAKYGIGKSFKRGDFFECEVVESYGEHTLIMTRDKDKRDFYVMSSKVLESLEAAFANRG